MYGEPTSNDYREIAARPLRFYKTYPIGPDGEVKTVEWVEWSKPGQAGISNTNERVSAAQKTTKWKVFAPAYDAWKAGQDMPANGTPLEAWPGITPEQIDVVKCAGIRTLEDLSVSTEKTIAAIRLPEVRKLVEAAKMFLDSKDAHVAAEQIRKMKEERDAMRDEIAELKALLDRVDLSEVKPKRHRRTKAEMEAARAEQAQEEDVE